MTDNRHDHESLRERATEIVQDYSKLLVLRFEQEYRLFFHAPEDAVVVFVAAAA